ncbi:MAG TPA: hypothetical protein VH351_03585 [Bryobacteraceae bacterium]|nr:hypothetical protein [Bryobacteraceae bacterium]
MGAQGALADDQLKMLQDPGGWEYIKISDVDNGIQTVHTCFDGHPHPRQCSGTLTFSSGNTFVQKTRIHGQTVQRQGTYQMDGNELTFFDELGTKDGPYTLNLNTQTTRLVMEMLPVRISLQLEKQYRKDRQSQKQPLPSQ